MASSATSSSVCDASEEKTNGTRLARLLVDGGTDVLRKFLHSMHPPRDKLKTVLKNNQPKLVRSVKFDDQREKLFPSTGDPPDSSTFDITLLHLLIREVCHLHPPVTGWHKMPAEDDDSVQANITRIKCFRNELSHSASTGIPSDEFEIKWNKISSSLEAIEGEVYRRKIQVLKHDPIDHDTRKAVEEQVEYWRWLEKEERDNVTDELCSYLPDKPPKERMFGRSKELEQVKNKIQSGKFAVVLITGGPGFGKTTVAKAVAHELSKPENNKTVLFCSLLAKKSFNEVTTEMLLSCDKIPTLLPENQDQWLKGWSKRIQTEVTFVLDNADDVLESEPDRDLFLRTLSDMRKLSKQKVTFVMTSRKTFKYDDLPSTDVRIEPLSPEEAKKVLFSRVSHEEIRPAQLSKTDKIVELCGRVPLALSIVGSLLSDYTEEKLIKHLEQEPMAILEDEGESFQTAIKGSFDLLSTPEQDALVLLSIFPGSFDCDAAEAVLRDSPEPGKLPISIIRSLKNRSLIEQVRFRRYQLHPLIRAFAKKINQRKDAQLLIHGEKLACAHFISRLDDNATLYWGKDTCKQSIDSFSEDRHNYEHFLQVYAQGMEVQDQRIMDECQKFLDVFPQKCMYLEKCLQPTFYIQVLERLLKSFKPDTQPVHLVELLCLLGHEMRKVGEEEKYTNYMENARKLYSKNLPALEQNPLSQVIYLESEALFLSAATGKSCESQPFYDTALTICQEKLPDHPETAAVLLFAGRNARQCKENQEAGEKFKKSYDLFEKQLGDHFMTAQCLKEMADYSLGVKELDNALRYYEMVMEMMEKLGTQDQKENILNLKNYGMCHRRKGNFAEAKSLLQRAERAAERELENDHPWKVLIKTCLGILLDVVARKQERNNVRVLDKMEASMKEGLEMHYRINDGGRNIEKLRYKYVISKVLERYPNRFPQDQYPWPIDYKPLRENP